ncbi:MAG: biopolymer transporter ExbD [Pirellulaceae bacterium]|nr:biopolymer transporter ExbD [Planctomycetaceae bacterium]HIM30766.1 biopolymer transporter ExbD [Planctomycetota bacterium]
MRAKRATKLLIEPPSSATGDIAFNLIIFFLVCASVQPESGREQSIPRSQEQEAEREEKHIEVQIRRNVALINGVVVRSDQFARRMERLLKDKKRNAERVVVVKSDKQVEYQHWIRITEMIETAGGIITIQMEEVREVLVN